MNAHDEYDRRSSRSGAGGNRYSPERPRVVILEAEGEPRVEVLNLPDASEPGDCFCHSGTRWQVTATRTGDRVLIARPAEA